MRLASQFHCTDRRAAVYRVGRLPSGTYYFQCDVHPPAMHVAFVVG